MTRIGWIYTDSFSVLQTKKSVLICLIRVIRVLFFGKKKAPLLNSSGACKTKYR